MRIVRGNITLPSLFICFMSMNEMKGQYADTLTAWEFDERTQVAHPRFRLSNRNPAPSATSMRSVSGFL